jgi:hypothetical protein
VKTCGIRVIVLIAAGVAARAAASDFVPGGPCTRGRVTIEAPAVVTDWGTRLRGGCWCQDCHGGVFPREELREMKLAGLNAIHVYGEKNDDKPVGYEVENLDSLVEWCRQESLYIVITFGNSRLSDFSKVLEFWRFYAPRYADMTHVIYEEKNEGCAKTAICEEPAKQMYRDVYKIIREVAPETHIMLLSHSNIQQGIPPLYTDIAWLGPEVDWTNASIAYHGYGASAQLQEQACTDLGSNGYAMSCTEFPFNNAAQLGATYERAGISYFWFEGCWGGTRTPGAMKDYLSRLNLSWQPDFGDWPQPHVEHPEPTFVQDRPPSASAGRPTATGWFTPYNLPNGAIHAAYDLTGRLIWKQGRGAAGAARGHGPGIPAMLGSAVLLIRYTEY